tara:strand:+ start:55 stop:648 length:594 start_codon:yes stop_codon:yes gene_type:complete
MTTYSNLKYNHSLSANATGTGSLNLISTQTASGSANLSFTSGIDSTYKEYVFKFINLHPQTAGEGIGYNFTTDGTNFNVVKTTTAFRSFLNESGTGGVLDYQDAKDLAQGSGDQPITWDCNGNNDSSTSGTLSLFDPSSTTFVKHFIHQSNGMHENPACFTNFSAGYCNTTSAVTGAIFKYTSGNIDSGTILMYGVK